MGDMRRFRDIRPGPGGPPDPADVLQLWFRPPVSRDLVRDGADLAAPKRAPFRHWFGHVRFRVRLPDRSVVFVEFNPDDDPADPSADAGKTAGTRPGSLTSRPFEPGYVGGGEGRNKRVALPLTQKQVDVLLELLDGLFPDGIDSEVEDFSRYHLFRSNCATTLGGIYLTVIDRGGPRLPRQKRLRRIFKTARVPATLWPRVRAATRRPGPGRVRALPALAVLFALLGCPTEEPVPEPTPFVDVREPCAVQNPLRDVLWGDLHAHSSWSFDAWVFDVRTDPEQAYAFARGEAVQLPPLDAQGVGTQTLRLERPLDFAAVTDHGEYLAEVSGCTTPGSAIYNFPTCEQYRSGGNDAVFEFGLRLTDEAPERFDDICGDFGIDCASESRPLWQRLQDIAEAAYDRSAACSFTSFVAYEYSAATGVSNLHRNVIFRNATVPAQPAAYFEHETPARLWDALRADCIDADGPCDVLAIPHNANWSNGNLFAAEYEGTTVAEQAAEAEARADLEPIVEIYQHKGDSECSPGLSGILGTPDELCGFEKLREPPFGDCGDGVGGGAMGGLGCISRADFLRGALLRGLEEEARIGANPFPLGVIASTDTHNGIPGAVEEDAYLGHWGNNEDTPAGRLGSGALTPGGVLFSAGGLAAVWSESNDRDAIFDAIKRREVYGTSGPRITVRLFGGAELPEDLCEREDAVAAADAAGVPMGGELSASDGPPRFFLWATMDPGTAARPGTELERIQIVKGWIDAGGERHVTVFDVGGGVGDAGVDLQTCATTGDSGAPELCAVWTDPGFVPDERAWYYARVVENPTCRWSTWACNGLPEAERPESCSAPEVPKTVQERAWTSPIWVTPEPAAR